MSNLMMRAAGRLAAALAVVAAISPADGPALAQGRAAAAPPFNIAMFVSSRQDVCFDQGDVAAITQLSGRVVDKINRQGGVLGRQVQLTYLDDKGNTDKAIDNLRAAMRDAQTVAMIGLSNSVRAKAAFDAAGKDVRDSGIPFLSNISIASLFKDAPNVFSTQVSQDEERVPVMAQFIKAMQFGRIAFAGVAEAVTSDATADGLKALLTPGTLVAELRLRTAGSGLETDDIASAVTALKAKTPDMLVIGTGGNRAAALLKALTAAQVTPALFVSGRIEALPQEIVATYPNAIYQLAWNRLPEADNYRLRRLIAQGAPDEWMFEGKKIADAPGWANGTCKARPEGGAADPFEAANQRAIGIGAQFADMVALTMAAMRTAPTGADVGAARRQVLQALTTTFAAGRGIFKGGFDAWSFHPGSRTALRTPFVVIQPQGLGRTQLAPIQFVRLKDNALRQIETLYLDVDLVKASRVEDSEKSFAAELYVAMRSLSGAGIEQLDFTNAFLDPRANSRQISIETLHGGGPSTAYPEGMKVYKVTGRFTFEPDLSRYPFDTQRFAIDIQPKRADAPFVVQPPPASLRETSVVTDGWAVKSQFVGYGEDYVPVLDAYTHVPSVVPFYKASFVWMMKRQTTDYILRVVVPLGFILIVAYFSYFISTAHFEAIVTIQVTALLSAVALYLSLPKLDADDATLSDRLFVFNYMMVSLMIGISILRVNRHVHGSRVGKAVLGVLHVVGVPLMVAAMYFYVRSLAEV